MYPQIGNIGCYNTSWNGLPKNPGETNTTASQNSSNQRNTLGIPSHAKPLRSFCCAKEKGKTQIRQWSYKTLYPKPVGDLSANTTALFRKKSVCNKSSCLCQHPNQKKVIILPNNTVGIMIKEIHHIRCGNEKCRSIIIPGQKIWTVTVLDEKGVSSTHICCCPKCAMQLKRSSISHYEKIVASLKAAPVMVGKMARPISHT